MIEVKQLLYIGLRLFLSHDCLSPVNQILGNGGYNLIVDDSHLLAATLQGTSLRDRAVWGRSDLPFHNYGIAIVAKIAAR